MSAEPNWRAVIAATPSPIKRAALAVRLREDEPDPAERAALWWALADAMTEGLNAFRDAHAQFHDLPPLGTPPAQDDEEPPGYDDLWAAGF